MHRNWLNITENTAESTADIYIEGNIGSYWKDNTEAILTKEEMQQELKKIADLQVKKINVHINSYGGDVNHGISIHDLLALSKAEVTTIVNGHTASAATIISQAGKVRKMSANALFLVHNASLMAWGDKNELKTALDVVEKVDATIANIYAKRAGKSVEDVLTQMNKFNGSGEWLTADTAKELGYIDEVFEPMKAAAHIGTDILTQFGLPQIPEKILNILSEKNKALSTNLNTNTMKIKVLAAWAAVISFLGFDASKENELTSDDVAKLNNELANRAQTIATLTEASKAHKTELDAANAAKVKAEGEVTALQSGIAVLESENALLKKNAGAITSTTKTAAEIAAEENTAKDADVEYCKTHTIAENVAYLRDKRK